MKLAKIIICSLCIAAFNIAFAGTQSDRKVVEVEKVKNEKIEQTIRLLGIVKAKRSIELVAKTNGVLQQIAVNGQKINKGQLIAKLESPDLEKTMKLSLESTKLAKAQYERLQSLVKTNSISKRNIEEAKHQWLEAQKAYLHAKIEYEKNHFTAPFAGFVGVYKVRDGMQVREGHKIVSLYDPSELGVEFDIPAKYLSQIHPGQKITIHGKPFALSVVQNMIDPETLMAPAYVELACEQCFIGEIVHVDLALAEQSNAVVISHEGVFYKNGEQVVYTVKDNKVVLTPVTVGIREKDKVQILDGLKEGDLIVAGGQTRLYPDMPVKTVMTQKT